MSRRLRLLLVEDADLDAALVLMELRKGGYELECGRVETAAAMNAALDRQPWDIVIADYILPQFSGPAALKILQRRGLDLPFIIVSGHIDEDTAVASMKAGAHDYVMKGRLARLVPAIERELQEAESRRARKQSEGQFAREQAFRRALEDSIPSGITAVDHEGRHTYVNPAFCRLVDWSETELLRSSPPYPYWPPEEVGAIQELLALLKAGQAPPGGFELRLRRRDETRFDVLVQSIPFKDSDGTVTGWLSSFTDITQRKQAVERLRVQYDVARVLSQSSSLVESVPRILAAIAGGLKWEMGALWRIQAGAGELRCAGTWHRPGVNVEEFEAVTLCSIFLRGAGLPGRVLASGQPIWMTNVSSDRGFPRYEAAERNGLHCACGFPIRLGGDIIGVMEFLGSEIREPDETLLQWMAALGNQIGQFMEREMAQEALRRAHAELEQRVEERTADLMAANAQLENVMQERKRLEHELLEITENERRRIGLDLHDDLGQKLSGLTLMTKALQLSLEKKKLAEAADARKIQTIMQQTMDHAKGLARDLALADLAGRDLPAALRDLAANVEQLFNITCQSRTEGEIPQLDQATVTQFYKITQEAVTNAVRHGNAKLVTILLQREPHYLVLSIRNNGNPFPDLIEPKRGMGLRIMNYRANVIGASFDIKPGRPKGTVISCRLPLNSKPQRGAAAAEKAA